MTGRLALVVDDSKTARVTLQRLLERQGLDVDSLESAQQALEYLANETPDVIFMDHMMPGMDGFEAVEAIKSNPTTATIPIMMYTSKGGDLYVSQARALGAVGIIPKQVKPAELFEVLKNLSLVKDRRAKSAPEDSQYVILDNPPEIAAQADRDDIREIARIAEDSVINNNILHGKLGEVLENQHSELKREVSGLKQVLEQLAGSGPVKAPVRRQAPGFFIPLMVVAVMLIPLLGIYKQNSENRLELDKARNEVAQLQAIQEQQVQRASEEAASLREMLDTESSRSSAQSGLLFQSITWAVNLASPYDVREEAFSDRRLTMVYELISRLDSLGFRGEVQLDSHLGEFCLTGNEVDGYELAPADLPVRECTLYGHPLEGLPSLGERQSIAFANFLATSPLVNNGDISIEIIPHRYNQPRLDYPSRDSDITAYEWNRIATTNNRVDISLIPADQ